jgi:hypothetical protein
MKNAITIPGQIELQDQTPNLSMPSSHSSPALKGDVLHSLQNTVVHQ